MLDSLVGMDLTQSNNTTDEHSPSYKTRHRFILRSRHILGLCSSLVALLMLFAGLSDWRDEEWILDSIQISSQKHKAFAKQLEEDFFARPHANVVRAVSEP